MLRVIFITGGLLHLLSAAAQAQPAAGSKNNSQALTTTALSTGAGTARAPEILFAADEMPSYPGGNDALLKFLAGRLVYPGPALDHNISGKVYVTFTVDGEGRLRDPRVVKGLGSGLDDEALRLVRLMPWWNPGKNQGLPVWVQMTLPIAFRLM